MTLPSLKPFGKPIKGRLFSHPPSAPAHVLLAKCSRTVTPSLFLSGATLTKIDNRQGAALTFIVKHAWRRNCPLLAFALFYEKIATWKRGGGGGRHCIEIALLVVRVIKWGCKETKQSQ